LTVTVECDEPLVDLCDSPLLATIKHPKARSEAETRLHCREGVAQRHLRADMKLQKGIRLLIVECHRPLELQDAYWETQLKSLRERHPDWPEDKLAKENAKFVAPPEIVPPHSPGGAVDLVLVDAEGEELNMGSFLNEKGPVMHTEARGLTRGARRNRTPLLEVMKNAGFATTLTSGGTSATATGTGHSLKANRRRSMELLRRTSSPKAMIKVLCGAIYGVRLVAVISASLGSASIFSYWSPSRVLSACPSSSFGAIA
jgi:D-alanyl-D-alanine dipeptidase